MLSQNAEARYARKGASDTYFVRASAFCDKTFTYCLVYINYQL